LPNYYQNNSNSPLLSLAPSDKGYSFGTSGSAALVTTDDGGLTRSYQQINGQQMLVVTATTQAAHNMAAGQPVVILNSESDGGTIFDGNYVILSIPSTTTLVLLPTDSTRIHQALDVGDSGSVYGIQFDTPVAPQAGQAFALVGLATQGVYAPFSFDLLFSGAPGAFELDVQSASVDSDSNYQTIANGNITAVDAINQTAHFEAQYNGDPFVRAKLKSLANAVGLLAIFKR
jgi:hypothetical protein